MPPVMPLVFAAREQHAAPSRVVTVKGNINVLDVVPHRDLVVISVRLLDALDCKRQRLASLQYRGVTPGLSRIGPTFLHLGGGEFRSFLAVGTVEGQGRDLVGISWMDLAAMRRARLRPKLLDIRSHSRVMCALLVVL